MHYDLTDANDGNAFSLMAYTSNAMKEEGFSKREIDDVMCAAQMSDYDNLIFVLDHALQQCNEARDREIERLDRLDTEEYYAQRDDETEEEWGQRQG